MIAPNMRQSLSIKDDDYRLSFLYGNFVTMTNMGPNDFRRIKQFHLEEAGADYHTQVVLCAGLNDGAELERTIREVVARRPHALSLAIVPVGITKYRTDPFPLHQFDAEGAARVIDEVEKWQKKIQQEEGRTFIYLGDEFYFLAGRPVPPTSFYDGFPTASDSRATSSTTGIRSPMRTRKSHRMKSLSISMSSRARPSRLSCRSSRRRRKMRMQTSMCALCRSRTSTSARQSTSLAY